jgi:XTP/dITP diphosphohydrolase
VNTIILATRNVGKVKEIIEIFRGLPFKFKSLFDFPNIPEVVEDGDTLQLNALKKAREIFNRTNLLTISDDSGLEVTALDNRPGVYSARYAGEEVSYEDNNKKLLKELENVPYDLRTARFRCVAALVNKETEYLVEGVCSGKIAHQPQGANGFGYDPLFIPDGYEKTFAELSNDIKNQISHRAKAFHRMKEVLKSLS